MKRHKRKPTKRLRPEKTGPAYAQLWRLVDGAIIDTFRMHPDYLTPRGTYRDTARRSIAKRVTGAILGFAEQSARGRARSPCLPAAERAEANSFVKAHDVVCTATSPAIQMSAAGGFRCGEARP